jgi:predicted dehydrogenase
VIITNEKINWGILGTATIALEKVIPALKQTMFSRVEAIASRNIQKSRKITKLFNIPLAYGSYEDLLSDQSITAVYIPLPNSLHVEWVIKSLQAGKHVLCEKPISHTLSDAEYLYKLSIEFPNLKLMEAFMYRFHPQWHQVHHWIQTEKIGDLEAIISHFSFFDDDPGSIVNKKDLGGGSLLDIGCYCISLSRYLFHSEPKSVFAHMEFDPRFNIERQTTAIMKFNSKYISRFTSATQQSEFQKVILLGSSGYIEMDTPFIVSAGLSSEVYIVNGKEINTVKFKPCNQYKEQFDSFSKSIINNEPVPLQLSESVANMRIIEALQKSAKTGNWVEI